MILQLVASCELFLANRAAKGSLGNSIQRRAELTSALASVHHVLDLQQAGGHLVRERDKV